MSINEDTQAGEDRPTTFNDVLSTLFVNAKPPPAATRDNTALLLIDIQHIAEPSYFYDQAVSAGLPPDEVKAALADYETRFHTALDVAAKVLEEARAAGIPPIHVKIQTLSCQGRDTSALHARMGWNFPPNSPATRFLEPTKPRDDEIVITKTASGAFTGTGLDSTLRNMGVENIVMIGFMTDECVETTARVALDYGYVVKVVSEATTTYYAEAYQATISKLGSYGFTQPADATIAQFRQMGAKTPLRPE